MDPLSLVEKYYERDSKAHYFLVRHSRLVAKKAAEIAHRVAHLDPDLEFIEEGAMLHDIGMLFTNAPKVGCYGQRHYLCHGCLGRELLEREGMPELALVCERHVGMGFTAEEIERDALPLPARDMAPLSLEEKIICFADKFFSKSEDDLLREKPLEEVRETVKGYGAEKLVIFDEWMELFLGG
ncbi:MAG: HD domain-containing protein [Nitrospirae bacterium]|nr:HD domain-containing protein [Nitrospirota bacterium]